jgi:hypothetical protein
MYSVFRKKENKKRKEICGKSGLKLTIKREKWTKDTDHINNQILILFQGIFGIILKRMNIVNTIHCDTVVLI